MALGRISGAMLTSNLERDGNDLAFETDLLYLDVTNGRIGVKTTTPQADLDVNGVVRVGNILINGSNNSITPAGLSPIDFGTTNNITISGGNTGYVLTTDGSGNLTWASVGALMTSTGSTGMQITLGSPTKPIDQNVAWDNLTDADTITNAINELNQTALNIAKGTYVGASTFTADVTAGPSPMSVTFTSDYVGTATDFLWDFGDGNTSTNENPTHTYNDENGGQFTVTFKAYNADGTLAGDSSAGAVGSWDDFTRTNYITLYTPNPIPAFSLTAQGINSGTTGTITNSSQYATSYSLNWGDGTTVPLTEWSTENHTFTNSLGDEVYAIQLTATSSTAGPTPVTVTGNAENIYVYSTHTPSFTTDTVLVINEEATSGGVVAFTNTTATDPGPTATFSSNRYQWTWGDGSSESINIGNGIAGNPGSVKTHTYALTAGEQALGTTRTFDAYLAVVNGHTQSPFPTLAPVTITVEPDVRSNFTGTALTLSDRTGDNAQTGYLFTDYRTGADRALFEFTTTSQHATEYNWSFGDGTLANSLTEGDAGTVNGGPIQHAYTTTGNKTVVLSVAGQPATLAQTDTETRTNYVNIRTNPPAPGELSTKTLSIATTSQGTSPKLAASATDNSGGNIPAAGTSVSRFVGSQTIASSAVTDVNTSASGTLSALVNGQTSGTVNFDPITNKSATYSSLVVSDDRDAHNAISAGTYPSGFYKVFNANISHSLSSLGTGYNSYQLSHTESGDTNIAGFVKDDLTSVPTVNVANVTIAQNSPGTLTYISGVPYYNTGGSITVSGIEVTNLIGQTYRDTSSPLTILDGANLESTTDSLISTQTYSYSAISNTSSPMLVGGIPVANTGSTAYTLADISVNINGSARAVGTLSVQMQNVNGSSTAVALPTPINVYSKTVSGFDETSIPVSSSLGGGFSDNGKRVALGLSGDNPAYTPVDFYTNDAWSGAETIEGTDEAVVRWGVLKHFDDEDFSTYLPPGPDLITDRSGAQYFTFAFRRALVANFDITLTGKVSGMWIAAPGTGIDSSASSTNGWIDCNATYAGAGLPGTNTAAGGNGNAGCASTSGDRIPLGTVITNQGFTMTLGTENLSNATGKNCLVRIRLESGDYINSISVGVAA